MPRKDSLKPGIALDGSPYGLAAARFVARHRKLFGPAPAISLIHVAPELTKIVVPGWLEREVETGIKPEQVESMHKAAFESYMRSGDVASLRVRNEALAAWARRKYKRFRRRERASMHWLGRIARRDPQLFVLWQLGVKPEAGL